MTCKLDHSAAGTIPAFLCRACHPELNRTRTQLDELEAQETAKRHAADADAERSQAREIARLHADIDRLRSRNPEPGSVAGKILASQERKLASLEGIL